MTPSEAVRTACALHSDETGSMPVTIQIQLPTVVSGWVLSMRSTSPRTFEFLFEAFCVGLVA